MESSLAVWQCIRAIRSDTCDTDDFLIFMCVMCDSGTMRHNGVTDEKFMCDRVKALCGKGFGGGVTDDTLTFHFFYKISILADFKLKK